MKTIRVAVLQPIAPGETFADEAVFRTREVEVPVPEAKKIYILSETLQQAAYQAQDLGLIPEEWCWVYDIDGFRGRPRGLIVYDLRSSYRPNTAHHRGLDQIMRERECIVIRPEDDR